MIPEKRNSQIEGLLMGILALFRVVDRPVVVGERRLGKIWRKK